MSDDVIDRRREQLLDMALRMRGLAIEALAAAR